MMAVCGVGLYGNYQLTSTELSRALHVVAFRPSGTAKGPLTDGASY
ncbi:hypothetical protein SAMN05443247_10389 [Bradyrhizobium erythrophlei]|jgi:hypothetical protein|nr:hypothetical protein SAMN05443247_10389 [Bradyrhizobium erythrophlei]